MKTASADDTCARPRTWLVFALGPYVMCASALEVEGIIQRPDAIAKLPLSPDYALGAFLFRGHSAAAISLRKKLKLRDGEDRASGPFVVARIGAAVTGFWVDEVRDVIEESEAEWRAMPAMLEGGLFERFAIRGNELILQTSFAALREAEIEFESLAEWVAARTTPAVAAAREAPDALHPAGAGSAAARPVASAGKDEASRPSTDLPGPHPAQPRQALPPVTPRNDVPPAGPLGRFPRATVLDRKASVRRPSSLAGAAPRADFAVARPTAVAPSLIAARAQSEAANGPEARGALDAPTVRDADPASQLAAPVRSSPVRLGIALGMGLSAIAALFYQLLPGLPDDRAAATATAASTPAPARSISSASVPQRQAGGEPAIGIDPEQVKVTIERRGDRPSEAEDVGANGAARESTARIHTVVAGDTLWQIAKQEAGDPFRYPELARLSRIPDPNRIRPGDVVRIEIRKQR